MIINRLMEVKLGKEENAAKFYFTLKDKVEILEALRRLKTAKPDDKQVNDEVTNFVIDALIKIENLFDLDSSGNQKAVTPEDLKAGRVPSYIITLIRDAYFAQVNSAENAEKKDIMSVQLVVQTGCS